MRLHCLGIIVYNVCTKTMASVETYCKSPAMTGSGRERQVMDKWKLYFSRMLLKKKAEQKSVNSSSQRVKEMLPWLFQSRRNKNMWWFQRKQPSLGSVAIKRCGFVRVGVTLLEDVLLWQCALRSLMLKLCPLTQFTSFCLQMKIQNSQLLLQYLVCLHATMIMN